MENKSFHQTTRGLGWSEYAQCINTGESSKSLIVPVPRNALSLIDVHNEQIMKLISRIEELEAAQQSVKPTKPNVGAGADFGYMLSQQIRDK